MGDARIDAPAETAAKRVQAFLDGLADIALLGDILFGIPGKQAPLITTDLVSLVASASECEKLREALRRYGKHHPGCPAEFVNGSRWTKFGRLLATGGLSLLTLPGECTCGLDAARALVGSAPQTQPEEGGARG